MDDTIRARVNVHAFPSDDGEFRVFVEERLDQLQQPLPDDLQREIRDRYPLATVVVRSELAARGGDDVVWYVFRRAVGEAAADGWWEREEAWAVITADRVFVEATESFAATVEVPLATLVGRRLEDLANPSDPTVAVDLVALWAELGKSGRADGTLRFNRLDGSRREIEYHVERDAAEASRYRAVIREV
jgi:PAS domain-containing protein